MFHRGHEFREFYKLLNEFKNFARHDEDLRFLVNLADGYILLSQENIILNDKIDNLKKQITITQLNHISLLHQKVRDLRKQFIRKHPDPKIRKAVFDDFYKPLTKYYKKVLSGGVGEEE